MLTLLKTHTEHGKTKSGKSQLKVYDLSSYIEEKSMWQTAPLRCDTFVIFWIIRGSGRCWVDLNEYTLTNDTLYCLHPGQLAVFNDIVYMEGCVLSFTSEFIYLSKGDVNLLHNSGLFYLHQLKPVTISGETNIEMEQLLNSIKKESTGMTE